MNLGSSRQQHIEKSRDSDCRSKHSVTMTKVMIYINKLRAIEVQLILVSGVFGCEESTRDLSDEVTPEEG